MMRSGQDTPKYTTEIETQQQTVKWRSPSNIAIIKYWGKHGIQLPQNPSLSFTLTNAHTTTEVIFSERKTERSDVDFLFEGHHRPDFSERVERYISVLQQHFPVLSDFDYSIRTENSFPHSTGIASSASAMSALALCFCTIAYKANGRTRDLEFWKSASNLARLGSGSACRSVYGPVTVWGKTVAMANSSNEYAVQFEELPTVFQRMHDSILIVDSGPKKVSSSIGHTLMKGHPFAQSRFAQAKSNIQKLIRAMHRSDLDRFMDITETEALSLHAMMMTSTPGFMLMKPGTAEIIERTQNARRNNGLPVCFTLDAGPNVHLLYPEAARDRVRPWIESELKPFCRDGRMIHDVAGNGPLELEAS